jgi:hypothetical protein
MAQVSQQGCATHSLRSFLLGASAKQVGGNPPVGPRNREINRDFSDSCPKIVEFCPKSANFLQEQGISREFFGYPAKLLSTRQLMLVLAGFKN